MFKGKSTEKLISEWLRGAEHVAGNNEWDDDRLKGVAFEWLENYAEEEGDDLNYQDWKDALIARLQDTYDLATLGKKLLKQTKKPEENCRAFLSRLNNLYETIACKEERADHNQTIIEGQLLNKVKKMRDHRKSKILLQGLLPRYKAELYLRILENTEDFGVLCKQLFISEKTLHTKEATDDKELKMSAVIAWIMHHEKQKDDKIQLLEQKLSEALSELKFFNKKPGSSQENDEILALVGIGAVASLVSRKILNTLENFNNKTKQITNIAEKKQEDLFAEKESNLGLATQVKHHINIGHHAPINQRLGRIPEPVIKTKIEVILSNKIIRESHSHFAAAIVRLHKKDGKMRIPYSPLTSFKGYLFILTALLGFLSSLLKSYNNDLKMILAVGGSLQRNSYKVEPKRYTVIYGNVAIKKWIKIKRLLMMTQSTRCAPVYFSTLDLLSGYWQIEIKENAPRSFQRAMNNILKTVLYKFAFVYLDDIIVFSNSIAKHVTHLEAVFRLLKQAGLKLKRKKCEFFKEELDYFGYIVSGKGITLSTKKLDVIIKYHAPKNVKELRKSVKRKWGEEQRDAFDCIKSCVITRPVLRYPDFSREFIIYTDASGHGIGAVLAQIQSLPKLADSAEFDGQDLHHRPLEWLMSRTEPAGRLARWALKIQEFDIIIGYRPGKSYQNADTHSCTPIEPLAKVETRSTGTKEKSEVKSEKVETTETREKLVVFEEENKNVKDTEKWIELQHTDKDFRKLFQELAKVNPIEGVWERIAMDIVGPVEESAK
ncbi:Uncharacterized protein APZ42_034231 [Daphnia magna]|uniref:Reverse transcriptase domain-containing protein n=1 Tax=Daphnia magna TaxID=35525 RepID=A0A164KB13_9CRUS|nr:Uncharacterized protein APZ42_034231 [Daphnia magna]